MDISYLFATALLFALSLGFVALSEHLKGD